MLQPRICLLGLLPFRPIIRIGCRPTPAECGLDRPAARARQIAGASTTRLHGNAVLGSVRVFCATSAARRIKSNGSPYRSSASACSIFAASHCIASCAHAQLTDATDVARCLCAVINSASTGTVRAGTAGRTNWIFVLRPLPTNMGKAYATAIMDMTRLASSGSRSALCGLRSARTSKTILSVS